MAHNKTNELRRLKQEMRAEALVRRDRQTDAEAASRTIFERIESLPAYVSARTLMLYLDIRSEVRTRWFVSTAWKDGKRVVVPYCEAGEIELFRLDSLDELSPGNMGVLEPRSELRRCVERKVEPLELDLIVVPGLAFDRRGGRLGYGKGYYDKLLHRVRNDALKAAVCFECQMVPETPTLAHDIRMDMIVTEQSIYRCDSQ